MNGLVETPPITERGATVLIGANGEGKSFCLREIAMRSLGRGMDVIAIAPIIHDRFSGIRRKQFKFFGARQGRSATKRAISKALIRSKESDLRPFEGLLNALQYAKFDPVVGVRIPRIDFEELRKIEDSNLHPAEIRELDAALRSWKSRTSENRRKAVLLSLRYHSFDELESLSFATIARHEGLLKRMKLISGIEYFLMRKGDEIPLLDACSGELSIVSTLAFIGSNITPRTVILIDEPENSLHPTWQKDYLKRLLDLLYRFEPTIVIATHSPIVVSGGSVEESNLTVFELKDREYTKFDHTNLNLEEMYERLFDLVTPKNHYLSRQAVALLNRLDDGVLELKEVKETLEKFKKKSYEGRQQEVLQSIKKLAEIVEERSGANG